MNIPGRILVELQYLPPANYMALLCSGVVTVIEQHEHYTKGSYRNRCQIAGANGPMRLSVPLTKGKNQQQPIRDVRIAYYEPWQAQHWQSIRSAYGSSPYFMHYADQLQPFYEKRYEFLFDFNLALLRKMTSLLKLPAALEFTEDYQAAYPAGDVADWRNAIYPGALHKAHLPYPQVFTERHGFLPNLSVIDLLFCLGPATAGYLQQLGRLLFDNTR